MPQNSLYVRCVSGVSKEYSSSFIDNGDGTVKDNTTGLIWQKCSRGQNNDATCSGTATTANWSTALTYCSGLSLASITWRLPNVNELKTIVDTKSSNPSIDTIAFPSTVSDHYWSSTTYDQTESYTWYIPFQDGAVYFSDKSSSYYVRCVSGP